MKKIVLAIGFVLTLANPARCALTLELWQGVQNFGPYTSGAPSASDPTSIQGLRNWNFTGQSKLTSLSLSPGQQFIVKVVLRDHDSVGNGTGYTLSGTSTNNAGLMAFAFRFNYTPDVLDATRDFSSNGIADTITAWSGANATSASTNENYFFAISNFGPNYFTVGNLLGAVPVNKNGVSPFQQGNGDVLYPLANLVLTAGSSGVGSISLSKPTTTPPTFGSISGSSTVDYDADVWGSSGSTLFPLSFTVVPEPSSLLLGLVAIPGYFVRRLANANRSARKAFD